MCEDNRTEVAEFFILGFQNLQKYKVLLFLVFFISYVVIVNGNIIIIVLISIHDQLKIPMFLLLKHLSIADLMITSMIIPMMLEVIIKDGIAISVTACITQLLLFSVSGFVQCLLISVMSYDRYLAICNPMRYNSLMNPPMCFKLVACCWLTIVLLSTEFVLEYQLQFCGGNTIDHFFCDSTRVLELATSDLTLLVSVDLSLCIIVIFLPFAFIIVTYVLISFTIAKLSSTTGRWKAFSTCSSHLVTVCVFYGSLMTVYIVPSDKRSTNTDKFLSIFYIAGTPMMNPIIYSLRNHEIRKCLKNVFRNVSTLPLH